MEVPWQGVGGDGAVESNGRKKKKRGELFVGLGGCSWP